MTGVSDVQKYAGGHRFMLGCRTGLDFCTCHTLVADPLMLRGAADPGRTSPALPPLSLTPGRDGWTATALRAAEPSTRPPGSETRRTSGRATHGPQHSSAGTTLPPYRSSVLTMLTRIAVTAALVVISTFSTGGAVHASGNAPCVTAAEYAKVRKGNLLSSTHQVFGTSGRVLFQNGSSVGNGAREYPMCVAWARATGKKKVQVQYNNFATRGGPMRVVYIQYY